MDAKLYCDSKTQKFLENQLKDIIQKYRTNEIDAYKNKLDGLYATLNSYDEILGISISYLTIELDKYVDVLWCIDNIPDYFLTNTDIQHTYVPDKAEIIGKEAFRDCRDLTSITIPNTLIQIKESAFKNCVNLKKIIYKGTREEFDRMVVDNDNEAFKKAEVQCLL